MTRRTLRSPLRLFGLVALALASTWTASTPATAGDVKIDIDGDDAEISLSIDAKIDLVDGWFDADFTCDGDDLEPEMRELYTALERRGPRSRYRVRTDEGSITGRRHGSQVTLDIDGEDGDVVLEMPWAIAECSLGRNVGPDALDDPEMRLEIRGDDGGKVSIRLRR